MNPSPACRHLHTDGRPCGSPALRGEPFCFHHHTARRPMPKRADYSAPAGLAAPQLPAPDDFPAIQRAIGEVLRLLANGVLTDPRAGTLLRGLAIASQNLARQHRREEKLAALGLLQTPVTDFVNDPTHGTLAPEPRPLATVSDPETASPTLDDAAQTLVISTEATPNLVISTHSEAEATTRVISTGAEATTRVISTEAEATTLVISTEAKRSGETPALRSLCPVQNPSSRPRSEAKRSGETPVFCGCPSDQTPLPDPIPLLTPDPRATTSYDQAKTIEMSAYFLAIDDKRREQLEAAYRRRHDELEATLEQALALQYEDRYREREADLEARFQALTEARAQAPNQAPTEARTLTALPIPIQQNQDLSEQTEKETDFALAS